MKIKKRRFSHAERYAIWHCHGQRCWLCIEPLRLKDTTIDHFFPEFLLEDNESRIKILNEYGLTDDFNINGFNNWLPCHDRCNKIKATRTFAFIPGYEIVLRQLLKLAPKVESTAYEISSNVDKDKIFGVLFAAIEQETIDLTDIKQLLGKLTEEPAPRTIPEDIIMLEGGYWVHRNEIAWEGQCRCEQLKCVDSPKKVYTYFRPSLSPWVIATGLYFKCYDQIIKCPRCSSEHKRGHIGREGICKLPYKDQKSQTD